MKKLLLALALLPAAVHAAEPIASADLRFAARFMTSAQFPGECPGYAVVDGGLRRAAEKEGADVKRDFAAVEAAVNMWGDEPYNHEALIPELTRNMLKMDRIITDGLKRDRAGFCSGWGAYFVRLGILEERK